MGNHTLTDEDDRRHELANSALERESLIFLLFLPEENLGVITYTWVNGENKAGSMGMIFGRDNERLGQFHTEGVDVGPDADFDNWQVGPLAVRHGVPHKVADVSFQHEDIALEYHFEATTPPFTYHDNPQGCPSWLADNRLEQSGLVRGALTIGDRVVEFDTTGHRDHSWGNRDWMAIHHYKWINVQAGSDIAINLLHGMAMDQLYELGYVDRDGAQSPVVSIKADIERDPETYSYVSAEIEAVDKLGRTTHISASDRTSLVVWPAGGLESHDAAGPCTVDGVKGLLHIEEGWHPQFVQHRKAVLAQDFESEKGRDALAINRDIRP